MRVRHVCPDLTSSLSQDEGEDRQGTRTYPSGSLGMGLKGWKRAGSMAAPAGTPSLPSRVSGMSRRLERLPASDGSPGRVVRLSRASASSCLSHFAELGSPLSLVRRGSGEYEGSIPLGVCWLCDRAATVTQLPKVVVFVKKGNV